MKIAYLIAGTFNAGGMERVLTQKANWLAGHGYEVTIVTTDQRERKPYFTLNEHVRCYDLGINYDADNGRLMSKLLHFPVRQWRHRRRLEKLLGELKADVVVCMFNNDAPFVYKIKDGSHKVLEIHFSKNKKLQYERHGLWALADRWRTRQEERIVRQYEHFVVLTHEDAALWGQLPNMQVIPNACTLKPAAQPDLSQKHVLAVGRYDYQKGFDTLLNIWQRIVHGSRFNVKGWTLDIVGDGPQRHELQEQVERLGMADSVQLLRPTSDIMSLYLRSSILVMTSRYEGLPMVLLEARACGLPVVSFACPCGPRDIITDGVDGCLIEGRDGDLFSRRLAELMDNENLRRLMGAAAVKASEAFSEERIMQKWEKLLLSLQ